MLKIHYFSAKWCMPCKMISSVINEIGADMKGKIEIIKINIDIDTHPLKNQIKTVPTLIFEKNGNIVDTIIGAIPKHEIIKRIQENLESKEEF